jgi:hypothetical protein
MISSKLSRRLERLETRIAPIASEPCVCTIEFIRPDGTVASTLVFGGDQQPRENLLFKP